MSLSNEWFEYHLTPSGWINGSEKLDFGAIKDVQIPKDRVLTIRCCERIACLHAKPEEWREEVWRSKDSCQVQKLVDKFGACPEGYQNYAERK